MEWFTRRKEEDQEQNLGNTTRAGMRGRETIFTFDTKTTIRLRYQTSSTLYNSNGLSKLNMFTHKLFSVYVSATDANSEVYCCLLSGIRSGVIRIATVCCGHQHLEECRYRGVKFKYIHIKSAKNA